MQKKYFERNDFRGPNFFPCGTKNIHTRSIFKLLPLDVGTYVLKQEASLDSKYVLQSSKQSCQPFLTEVGRKNKQTNAKDLGIFQHWPMYNLKQDVLGCQFHSHMNITLKSMKEVEQVSVCQSWRSRTRSKAVWIKQSQSPRSQWGLWSWQGKWRMIRRRVFHVGKIDSSHSHSLSFCPGYSHSHSWHCDCWMWRNIQPSGN